MWELDHEEGWALKNWCFFELWCWRRFLRVPWTARRSNQSILKKINPEYSLEGLMLKLKLQYFGHLMGRDNSLKRPWCWEIFRAGEEEDDRDKMIVWHHWLNVHEFEQTLGDSEGQRSLACCTPLGCRESDTTEWLNNDKYIIELSSTVSFFRNCT